MCLLRQEFFGKVVRVDLREMSNTSNCLKSYRSEVH
jgi:hypothetical protein